MEHFINILLVDDCEVNINGLKTILSASGNNLLIAKEKETAINFLNKRDIGIILIKVSDDKENDFERLIELSKIIKEKNCYMLLVCDKDISQRNIIKGFDNGAVDYIRSPFNPNLVKAKINVFKTLYFKDVRINQLLRNIFPQNVLSSLNSIGKYSPKRIEEGIVLFTDFIAFSKIAKETKPLSLIKKLEYYFNKFDQIVERYQLEKIKTIGDAYMALGGVTEKLPNPSVRACLAAIEMRDFMVNDASYAKATGQNYWEIRIGVHAGPLVAGIIGNKKMSFDVWGDTVNVAARAEQNSETNSITITDVVASKISSYFDVKHRGKITIKYGDKVDMYFVKCLKNEFSIFEEGKLPNSHLRKDCGLIPVDFEHTRRDLLNRLKSALPEELSYHDIKHTLNVELAAERYAKLEGVNEEDLLLLKTAVLFHDAGFIVKYSDNEDIGIKLMKSQLPSYGFSKEQIDIIAGLINVTKKDVKPKTELQKIICDADHDYLGRPDYSYLASKLRIELELHGKKMTDKEWIKFQLNYLEKEHRYYTLTAQNIRGKGKQNRILELKEQLKKIS